RPPPRRPLFPYTTLFRSQSRAGPARGRQRLLHRGKQKVVLAAQMGGVDAPPPRGCPSEGLDLVGSREASGRIDQAGREADGTVSDRKSTRLNSSHVASSY